MLQNTHHFFKVVNLFLDLFFKIHYVTYHIVICAYLLTACLSLIKHKTHKKDISLLPVVASLIMECQQRQHYESNRWNAQTQKSQQGKTKEEDLGT